MSNIRVMGENLLVRNVPMEKKAGDIVVVQQNERHDNAMLAAEVMSIGPMAFDWEKKARPYGGNLPSTGDYILTKKYAGVDLDMDDLRVISDSDVLAIVDNETIERMKKWNRKS